MAWKRLHPSVTLAAVKKHEAIGSACLDATKNDRLAKAGTGAVGAKEAEDIGTEATVRPRSEMGTQACVGLNHAQAAHHEVKNADQATPKGDFAPLACEALAA